MKHLQYDLYIHPHESVIQSYITCDGIYTWKSILHVFKNILICPGGFENIIHGASMHEILR